MELRETVMQESAPEKVDETGGVLYGVKLIGHESANGYRYTEECLKAAVPKYEGVKSYLNHSDDSADRNLRDWTGIFRNPRYVPGKGVFADHHLRKTTDVFQGIIEAAQRFPTAIGYSHVADGDRVRRNNEELIDSIKQVFSVDHVADPATTAGMFESKKKKDPELQKYIDSIPANLPEAARTKLVEAVTAAWPQMSPGAADPQQQIIFQLLDAVKQLASSIMDANSQNAQAQADAAKQAADKAAADKAASDKAKADAAANPGANVPPTLESLQRKLDLSECKTMLLESGRAAKDEKVRTLQIETLADLKGDDKRRALLESWPKADAQKVRESRPFERPDASPPAQGGAGATDQEAASLKAYESRFEESLKRSRERIAKRQTA